MRTRNWRLVIVGAILLVLAIGFFLFMTTMAAKYNDPKAMMSTVGQVTGVVCAIAIVMAGMGLIGKKT